jgi:hypothetical protein
MERKTRHTMVNKRGQELYSSDSFFGFIASTIVVQLGSAVVFIVIAAVICGIASLFS